jgi:hypothetical protein
MIKPDDTSNAIGRAKWPRTAPVMPRWRLNKYDNDLCQLMVSKYRTEIEAYWKALDEFNGGKA